MREQVLAASKTHKSFKLPAGNYTFLFDIPLPNNAIETATGPEHKYHTYQVEAIVKRCYGKDLVLSQPLRIYRQPRVDASELFSEILPVCPMHPTWNKRVLMISGSLRKASQTRESGIPCRCQCNESRLGPCSRSTASLHCIRSTSGFGPSRWLWSRNTISVSALLQRKQR